MNAKQLIPAFSKRKKPKTTNILNVSEFYYDTIQGEGVNVGVPAAFLRLQKCFLGCTFCDTSEVWRHGNAYTYGELIKMMEDAGLKEKLLCGQYHLVITGGSPLLQQKHLIQFFVRFIDYFGFLPYIEIENECIIKHMMNYFHL
jgi:organic radical activating enzyme